VQVRSDTISSLGRAAHDAGLGAILGGNLFARVGMHPAVREVADSRERGKVVNDAWRRYGLVNGLGLAAIVAGWAGARAGEARPALLSARERRLAVAKDAAVAAVAVTGVASGVEGMRFARSESHGAVPLASGSKASPDAAPDEARLKRTLNMLGRANLAAALALVGVNAAMGQANFRRPPLRRLLTRNP
jgi:hypothetical protein